MRKNHHILVTIGTGQSTDNYWFSSIWAEHLLAVSVVGLIFGGVDNYHSLLLLYWRDGWLVWELINNNKDCPLVSSDIGRTKVDQLILNPLQLVMCWTSFFVVNKTPIFLGYFPSVKYSHNLPLMVLKVPIRLEYSILLIWKISFEPNIKPKIAQK